EHRVERQQDHHALLVPVGMAADAREKRRLRRRQRRRRRLDLVVGEAHHAPHVVDEQAEALALVHDHEDARVASERRRVEPQADPQIDDRHHQPAHRHHAEEEARRARHLGDLAQLDDLADRQDLDPVDLVARGEREDAAPLARAPLVMPPQVRLFGRERDVLHAASAPPLDTASSTICATSSTSTVFLPPSSVAPAIPGTSESARPSDLMTMSSCPCSSSTRRPMRCCASPTTTTNCLCGTPSRSALSSRNSFSRRASGSVCPRSDITSRRSMVRTSFCVTRSDSSTELSGTANVRPAARMMSAWMMASVMGKVSVKRVPCPASDSTSMMPDRRAMLVFTTSMPTPRPDM